MRLASDVIAMIPSVKPRLAMKALKEAIAAGKPDEFSDDEWQAATYDGWALLISPIGARVLKSLFENGKIPQHPGASSDLSGLDAYIATEDDFWKNIAEHCAKHEAFEKRVAEIANDPDCARPDELSSSLIDQIFIERLGYGKFGEMRIAGLECHKSKTPDRRSNSGKTTQRGTVYCWWFDESGDRCGDQVPKEVLNRRNDPARNWGLGRE